MIDVRHENANCGAVAFRLRCTIPEALAGDVILNAATLSYDDGRVIIDDDGTVGCGSLIVCQACGRPVVTLITGPAKVSVAVPINVSLPVNVSISNDRLFAITY